MKKLLSIILIGVMVIMGMTTFAACGGGAADWDALYEKAVTEWGYEGSENEFIKILLGVKGNMDDLGNARKSAFDIFKKYHPNYYKTFKSTEEEWIDDLIKGRLIYFYYDYSFEDDRIWIKIKDEFVHKEYTIEDFDIIDVIEIEKYSDDLYLVRIGNKGKRIVIDSMIILENLDFINYVDPNYAYPHA